jgi:dimethylaniline monooxygenase (N-oxide forming)
MGGRVTDLAPWPDFVDEDGVVHVLEKGRPEAVTMKGIVYKPDILIFATGYVQKFPFLDKSDPSPE